VVVGNEDALTPPHCACEMAGMIPNARLQVLVDCGHMSSMEQPEKVTQLLADWLHRN